MPFPRLMISSLILQIEERKSKLMTLFENGKLDHEKQQNIMGAIQELDNILKILDDLKDTEEFKENNPEDVFLYKPVNNGIFDFIK